MKFHGFFKPEERETSTCSQHSATGLASTPFPDGVSIVGPEGVSDACRMPERCSEAFRLSRQPFDWTALRRGLLRIISSLISSLILCSSSVSGSRPLGRIVRGRRLIQLRYDGFHPRSFDRRASRRRRVFRLHSVQGDSSCLFTLSRKSLRRVDSLTMRRRFRGFLVRLSTPSLPKEPFIFPRFRLGRIPLAPTAFANRTASALCSKLSRSSKDPCCLSHLSMRSLLAKMAFAFMIKARTTCVLRRKTAVSKSGDDNTSNRQTFQTVFSDGLPEGLAARLLAA